MIMKLVLVCDFMRRRWAYGKVQPGHSGIQPDRQRHVQQSTVCRLQLDFGTSLRSHNPLLISGITKTDVHGSSLISDLTYLAGLMQRNGLTAILRAQCVYLHTQHLPIRV
jgi:hypothetical protein